MRRPWNLLLFDEDWQDLDLVNGLVRRLLRLVRALLRLIVYAVVIQVIVSLCGWGILCLIFCLLVAGKSIQFMQGITWITRHGATAAKEMAVEEETKRESGPAKTSLVTALEAAMYGKFEQNRRWWSPFGMHDRKMREFADNRLERKQLLQKLLGGHCSLV